MNVLFFTNPHEDYLADALFHGFRSLLGKSCVDYPKCEIMYKTCPPDILGKIRGHGFTLYTGLLDDIEIDRFDIGGKIREGYFDLIVFSNIQRQFGLFTQYRPWLKRENTVIVDGEDTVQPFPARGFWWRRPYFWFLPKAHKDFLYFKREWEPDSHFSFLQRLLPKFIRRLIPDPVNLRPVSFSFPAEKIVTSLPLKTKKFPVHIVDKEVASVVKGSEVAYAFDSEAGYYQDLQRSKFGITTKRAGWDCLRHYEIAANGAVICFRDLDKKPAACAPHGLDRGNTVVYHRPEDLLETIDKMDEETYVKLQEATLKWINSHSTVEEAKRVLSQFEMLTAKNKEK